MYAPIVLFAFNRLEPLKRCVASLLQNSEAAESDLIVYVDGPRKDTDGEKSKVEEVRMYVKSIMGFRTTTFHFSDENKKLGPSIIAGVTEVIREYGRAIVIEDDLILSRNYLAYMNQCLDLYENHKDVFSVCGYSIKLNIPQNYKYDVYFGPRSNSWGWATWKDRWEQCDWTLDNWKEIERKARAFNRWGGSNCFSMLKAWKQGLNQSWAIRFCYNQFEKNAVTVFPVISHVDNEGFDGEGTNCRKFNRYKFEFDNTENKEFVLPQTVVTNKGLTRQRLWYNSIPMRAYSRIMNFFYEKLKQNAQTFRKMNTNDIKTVAIWAPLRFVNYGDDMQAIAFALHIKSLGYNVKVFLLEESLAKKYDLQTVGTCKELFQDVNLCIIAGGSHMVPLHPAKQWLSSTYRQYELDFYEIVSAMKANPNLKICPLSIGGDGKEHWPLWYYGLGRYRLFHSKQFIDGSVRLEGDVVQMAKMGKKMVYYPDMLFRSADYFEPEYLPKTTKYRVGFNFKKNSLDMKMIEAILGYAAEHDDIEFHFTTTHMDKANLHYQYIPEKESKNIFIDKYTSPNQLLGVLGSMDVFITSMLHVGLTGLTMGTPCLSYRGPGKTKAFLRSIGGDWAIVDDDITFERLRNEYFTQTRGQLYSRFDENALESFKTESGKHYDLCTAMVQKFA